MRLLILLGGQVFSGAEITTLRFAAALPSDWNVEVAAHPTISERAVSFGLKIHEWENESAPGDTLLRASHFIDEPNQASQPGRDALDQIVSAFQPERIIACMFPVAMLALPILKKHSIPLFVHHQLMYKDMPKHSVTVPVRRVADYADCIIAASHAVEQPLLRSGIQNVTVIHAGLPSDYGTEEPRSALDKIRFLAVGTWGPQKGLETLLNADQLLRSENFKYDLVVVGPLDAYSPEYEKEIRSLSHKSVYFTGDCPDPTSRYRNADILIVPSSEPDPYPTVTLEGMAHGLAIIATDCGGLSEQVMHNETGLLVPATEPRALADAMRRLMLDPSETQQMGNEGRRHFVEIADINRQTIHLSELLSHRS